MRESWWANQLGPIDVSFEKMLTSMFKGISLSHPYTKSLSCIDISPILVSYMKSCFEMTKLINVHIHTYISWWEHFKSTQSSSIPHILWLTADAILCSRFPWTYSFHHYEILNALTNMCPTIPPPLPVHAMWLLHVREVLWYLSSHDWFISLNIMSSSFIHEVTGNKVPSFFFKKIE